MECAKCYLITTPFGLNSCHNANCLTSHSCDKRLFPGKFRLDLFQVNINECLKYRYLLIERHLYQIMSNSDRYERNNKG